jgi:Family of unknown function (DUF6338)
MEFPTTVAGIAAIALAVLPGIPGDKVYRLLVGGDWREDTWRKILRLLSFSVAGLASYWLFARITGTPLPVYVIPGALEHFTVKQFDGVFLSLIGHFIGAGVSGGVAAFSVRLLARFSSETAYGNAWDHFIKSSVRNRWVIIGLQNGESYAGYIDVADTSVAPGERDIVLREPALFEPQRQNYRFLEHQALFLLGSTVASIAVLNDPAHDERIVPIGDNLFNTEDDTNGRIKQGLGVREAGEGVVAAAGTNGQTVAEGSYANAAADTKIEIRS